MVEIKILYFSQCVNWSLQSPHHTKIHGSVCDTWYEVLSIHLLSILKKYVLCFSLEPNEG